MPPDTVFRQFLRITTSANCEYLFDWLGEVLIEGGTSLDGLIREVFKHLETLVKWDKYRLKEILRSLKRLGSEFVPYLE
jgi:hypothetical protein